VRFAVFCPLYTERVEEAADNEPVNRVESLHQNGTLPVVREKRQHSVTALNDGADQKDRKRNNIFNIYKLFLQNHSTRLKKNPFLCAALARNEHNTTSVNESHLHHTLKKISPLNIRHMNPKT